MAGVLLPAHLDTLSKASTPDGFKTMVWELLKPHLEGYKVCNTDVLFVTYIEPEKTTGGLYKAQQSQQEILFQGNVGLVVGMGPLVNKYDSNGVKWESHEIKLNDWIVTRFADCWEVHIGGVSCRLIDPENIRGIIDDPAIITHRPTPQASSIVPARFSASTSIPASAILRG